MGLKEKALKRLKREIHLKIIWGIYFLISKCLDINRFSLNFGLIFSFSKAKNAVIAVVLTSIFNKAERKKNPKLVEVICVQALKAVDRICKLRKLDPKKARLSFICKDIGQISQFSLPIDNVVFKVLKKNLPGPFTFVLNSNHKVPKLFKNKKRTIGVRIPNHNIPHAIIESLGRPILTTSLKSDDEILEYFTDPLDFYEDFNKLVDIIIDGGVGKNIPSAVIDCTSGEPEVIRSGEMELVG